MNDLSSNRIRSASRFERSGRLALLTLFAGAAVLGAPFPASAQAAAKPACAAGDTVVWENTSSKAYHLPGDTYYGHTKHGAYACRSAADAGGYHLAGTSGTKGSAHASSSKMNGAAGPAMPSSAEPTTGATPAAMHHGKHHHSSGATASPEPSPAAT